ncbi:uncharacterized protein IUM83_05138 [Phytophthora cinnamomi]|uniref:uncharacterized protein n=1 Tax=Phytophthora cinnamomi TaxID=4785 RepID=UPI00355958B7|nr:hypothetical protein IUM83_05138 [Phytophthora cinnamomi]
MKYERGILVYPAKVCNWILNDKSETKSDGKPYSMAEQLKILDRRKPARIQWTGSKTVDECIKHLPEHIRKKLLPAHKRVTNWVSEDFRDYVPP